MATLTLNNVPESVIAELQRTAAAHARSIDDEAVARLSRMAETTTSTSSPPAKTADQREVELRERITRNRAAMAAEGFTVDIDDVVAVIRRERDAKP